MNHFRVQLALLFNLAQSYFYFYKNSLMVMPVTGLYVS